MDTIWFSEWFVEFDRQVDVGDDVGCREENVENRDGQDGGQLHHYHFSM